MSQGVAVLLWLHSMGGCGGEHLARINGFDAEDGLAGRALCFLRKGRLSKLSGTCPGGKSRGRFLCGRMPSSVWVYWLKMHHIFINLSHITFWGIFPQTQLFFNCDIRINVKNSKFPDLDASKDAGTLTLTDVKMFISCCRGGLTYKDRDKERDLLKPEEVWCRGGNSWRFTPPLLCPAEWGSAAPLVLRQLLSAGSCQDTEQEELFSWMFTRFRDCTVDACWSSSLGWGWVVFLFRTK